MILEGRPLRQYSLTITIQSGRDTPIKVVDDASLPVPNDFIVIIFLLQLVASSGNPHTKLEHSMHTYMENEHGFYLGNMPDIVVMVDGWMTFTKPLVNLFVSLSHQNLNTQSLLLEVF